MSERARARIIDQIEAHGPMTWAEYMRLALYDPQDGAFASGQPVGPSGDFVTSAHVSGLFARLLAGQIERACSTLPTPRVVDVGAGDGVLTAALRDALAPTSIDVVAVEQNALAREAIRQRGVPVVGALGEVDSFHGVVFSNELFDNVPFHRVRIDRGTIREVLVGLGPDGALVEHEGEPSEVVRAMLPADPPDGTFTFSPDAAELLRRMIEVCERGYLIVIDYGDLDGSGERVRGYRGHRPVADLLADPGSADITGPVRFSTLIDEASAAGWSVWGPVDQRRALLAAGYREAVRGLRTRQREAEAAGRWRDAVRIFGARGDASALVDPAGLGAHQVLVAGSPGLPELPMTLAGDQD